MPGPELALEAIDVRFGRVAALRDCSLRVAAGECIAILGASGCGKTTLLRTVAGLEKPRAGRVWFGDRDVSDVPVRQRGVGFVFQYDALFARESAYENIAFGLRAKKVAADTIDARVRAIAARTRASSVLERRASTLSGGERQRVALARALATEPGVLLLDEPLSRLDAPLRLQLRRELRGLAQSRLATMVYVTHDQEEALTLGDRIAVMREGAIAQVAAARELFERPIDAFVAATIGSPAIAFVPAPFVFPEAAAGERCGVRASAVCIASDGALAGTVRAVEDFIDVAYAYVDGDFGTLIARVDRGARPRVGERVRVAVDRRRALRFAPDGRRLETLAHA